MIKPDFVNSEFLARDRTGIGSGLNRSAFGGIMTFRPAEVCIWFFRQSFLRHLCNRHSERTEETIPTLTDVSIFTWLTPELP